MKHMKLLINSIFLVLILIIGIMPLQAQENTDRQFNTNSFLISYDFQVKENNTLECDKLQAVSKKFLDFITNQQVMDKLPDQQTKDLINKFVNDAKTLELKKMAGEYYYTLESKEDNFQKDDIINNIAINELKKGEYLIDCQSDLINSVFNKTNPLASSILVNLEFNLTQGQFKDANNGKVQYENQNWLINQNTYRHFSNLEGLGKEEVPDFDFKAIYTTRNDSIDKNKQMFLVYLNLILCIIFIALIILLAFKYNYAKY